MKTRFAPSPTGHLHLGHAFAAAQAFNTAHAQNGTCLLRIEDIDVTRCKPEFTQSIYDDLSWLGFDWPEPVHIQSQNTDGYNQMLSALQARGLLYRCFKSRREINAELESKGNDKGKIAVYRGPKTQMSEDEQQSRIHKGEAFAWRLSMNAVRRDIGSVFDNLFFMDMGQGAPRIIAANMEQLGDEVLARRDIGLSYHLCSVHDDALQNITHIVRGNEFINQTGLHVLLQTLMGWPTPMYMHHKMVMGEDGQKLSKRAADITLAQLRKAGHSPDDVIDMAFAQALG